MSYGSIPGPSGQAVHKELHTLLQSMSWSYVALWSFNPQLRKLEFIGGHFRGNSSAETCHSALEIWNEQFFNFTHKGCMFTPGQGSVGMAYAERKNIWINGESVHRSAGSEQQAQFLQHARIKTAVYISSAESVLELGTCELVAEDVGLMNLICDFMKNNILPTLPGHAGFEHPTRSSSLNTDMFLQELEEEEGREEVRKLQGTKQAALMRFPYRSSHSGGTTSSSLSSFEDSSVKLSVDSPDPSVSLMASSSQCHNYATSTAPSLMMPEPWPHMDMDAPTLEPGNSAIMLDSSGATLQSILSSTFHGEPELLLLQQATSSSSSWPSDEPRAFKEWQCTHVVGPQRREGNTHQFLMRRSFEFLRHIPRVEPGSSVQRNFAPRLTSSSSPEPLPDPFDQVGPSRGQRRPRGGPRIGTPGRPEGHDEAAEHHKINERNRRKKQKENFTALRKLVPLISKNDKASILGDAIIYLKSLQARIQELEANMAEMASQYEKLKLSHQELQEQNKQVEAMVSATGPVLNP